MPGFARRPLAVFVCCMFAGMQVSHAALGVAPLNLPGGVPAVSGDEALLGQPIGDLAANDTPVRLRVERKFNVLGKKKAPIVPGVGVEHPVELKKGDSYPSFVVADSIEGRTDELTVAEGNVELRKAGSLVYADKLNYWPLEDEIEASGNVRLLQEGAQVETPYLRMKLSEQIGYAERSDYYMVKEVESKFYRSKPPIVKVASGTTGSSGAPMMMNVANSYGLPTTAPPRRPSEASGHAERMDFEGENQIRLTTATYSTCKPGQTDWYLQGSEVQLDYDQNVGTATHASIWFKDVPIFYSPVASFPLNSERKSGFLLPYWSLSTNSGFSLTTPYYWNIAPNYAATLYPRYMAKRGVQLGVDAEYLSHNFAGQSRFEYLPYDAEAKRERYAYDIQHQHNFGMGVTGLINWRGVSDPYYWEDMPSRLLTGRLLRSTQIPKQLVLNYSPLPWLRTSVEALRYQTLQPDPANPIAKPYFLEPRITFIGFKPNVLKTDFALIGQYSRFTHPEKTNGDRFVLYPQFSLPLVHPAFMVTPKIGLHMTKYSLNDPTAAEASSVTRTLPTFTLDSSVVFERETRWMDTDYIQTLEPRLYYVNIPYKDQSRIPVFDSGLADFNFAQIFTENRYSGFDRINDANQLTAGLTTRFLNGSTGVEMFKAMIGQRHYFKPQRVSIPGETVRTDDYSNLLFAATGLVLPKTYADFAMEYNYRDGTKERLSIGARYQPDYGKVVSASYRYTRDPLTNTSTVDQVDLSGQWPLAAKWYGVGRVNYSLKDKQLLEAIGGLEYNDGCWSARVVAQRLEAVAGTPSTNFLFQLELNDLTSIGDNPLNLLRRSIPGYGKTNELPSDGGTFNTP